MSDDAPPPRRPQPGAHNRPASAAERQERLARALKANLRRRKEQGRARAAPQPGDDDTDPSAPEG